MENKFYTFHQNNSGGVFHVDDKVSCIVIIEAATAEQANETAKSVAEIYFDGCEMGWDCDCCGDRWSPVYECDGTPEPSVYGKPLSEYSNAWTKYAVLWSYDPDGKMTAMKVFYDKEIG